MTARKNFIIIDGNSVAHRAFHALPPLADKQGAARGAVYGFALALFKMAEDFRPSFAAACFDTKEPTFRNKEFKDYKAQRPATSPDLIPQLRKIQELLPDLGVAVFAQAGFEADDLIATVIEKVRKSGESEVDFFVLTGDYDSLQLAGGAVKVFIVTRGVKNGVLFDAEKVREIFSVRPQQIPDLKALAGDASDNIPGAPGIGKKGAVEILERYSGLDEIYRLLETAPETFSVGSAASTERIKKILAENKEKIRCFKNLTTMRADAPIDVRADLCAFNNFAGDKPKNALLELGLPSLLKRLPSFQTGRNGTLF